MTFKNYAVSNIFGSLETCSFQSHPVALSPSTRGIEYPFSNSILAGLRPNFPSQNSTKPNIIRSKGELEASENYEKASRLYSDPQALRLRELKTYEEIGKKQNSLMIVIPSGIEKLDGTIAIGANELMNKNKKNGKKERQMQKV